MQWLSSWDSFVKTVETGSMSAAALRLNCTRAQISKQIGDLECSFGAKLFERAHRKLQLTPAGEVFYQQARQTLVAVRNTEVAMQNLGTTEPQGILRISATITLGRKYLTPLLPQFTERYPRLQCELILTDQILDLVEHNLDIALRITRQPPEDVVAKRLGALRRAICATPDYFQRYGIPQTPPDLSEHRCFSYLLMDNYRWHLTDAAGYEFHIPIQNRIQFNELSSIFTATLAGEGIAILPRYLCGDALKQGLLQEVLSDYTPHLNFGQYLYACYSPSRVRVPKVQIFLSEIEHLFKIALE
ncbi:LysR family transcriptional regulator [uncultured Thiothrix sp.]|uniref:LysR family transcriptional regulator n=1 Tax=uncultured Thiothrix sp. TaxID=223185 RepID=UPI0026312A9B|nr:LysR family transcriptional regulator [uncultured Thiothrix sp.]HMT92168.1 LysR family transcriptional regulator [Thiolinea sp.]